jgi:hypothetical protein
MTMNTNFSGDSMAKMAKANATLLKKMYELGCTQQLCALEKTHEALMNSQQDLSQSMAEAMNSGDGASMAKMMAAMPLWAMRAQMRQSQKMMELNSQALEQFGQPMREALTSWQSEVNSVMQGNSGGLARPVERQG